jgi:menaquinone C8-methyltransferase
MSINNQFIMRQAAGLAGYITRQGGQQFLKLNESLAGTADKLAAEAAGNEASLYIHIPFCRTLCPFCCFNRYPLDEAKAKRYFINLKREVQMYADRGFTFNDFYFGGGTPTCVMDGLEDFVAFLRSIFEVKRISLESTPREINPENIRRLQAIGVSRLSIGVQSFDDEVLKATGRATMDGAESRKKLTLAQGQFQTVNADIIFNFPAQSLESFRQDITIFKELGIDQATFYPLMPSPHKMNALEKRFNRVDTSRELEFYNIILRELYDQGYEAATAWCFSRGAHMIDEYIIDYDDYVGVGAGSVGFLRGNFLVNTFSLEKYDELINENRLPVMLGKKLAERDNLRYYMLTKLFGMSLDPARFEARFGGGINRKLGLEMAFFRTLGLVSNNGKIEVTRRGMYPVSVMMKEFFAALNGLREYCIEGKI